MCDCKKEIDPKPGEVWIIQNGAHIRVLILAIVDGSYATLVLGDSAVIYYDKSDFMFPSSDQSHDAILPNAAPQPLKLEVGKVFNAKNGGRLLCIAGENVNHEHYPYIAILLEADGSLSLGYEASFSTDGKWDRYDNSPHDLIKLSTNQSREIIL